MKKYHQILISSLILFFLIAASIVVIFYAKGYRFGMDTGKIEFSGTGLLVLTSNPDGAQVFINNHLTTATDSTINLIPGEYQVKIYKEGYFPWEKKIKVEKEVVAKADALLLSTAPQLQSITDTGVDHPAIDPSGTRLAYTIASQSARKNGIYVLDMGSRSLLNLQSASTQLADDTADAFSTALVTWSPDGQQIIATISAHQGLPTTYLLQTNGMNQTPQDVTETKDMVNQTWQTLSNKKMHSQIDGLKNTLKQLLSDNFNIISWSPDQTKILYAASQSAELPLAIKPRLIGFDSTPEQRSIEKNMVYVYDIKEDKNYKIDSFKWDGISNLPALYWFPDSLHLMADANHQIQSIEFDGSNTTTVYAGPFLDGYAFPWASDTKVVILTNLNNANIPPNLYTITLK